MEIKTAHKNSSQFGSRRFVAAVSFSLHTHLLTCDCAGCTIVAISPIFILPQEKFLPQNHVQWLLNEIGLALIVTELMGRMEIKAPHWEFKSNVSLFWALKCFPPNFFIKQNASSLRFATFWTLMWWYYVCFSRNPKRSNRLKWDLSIQGIVQTHPIRA